VYVGLTFDRKSFSLPLEYLKSFSFPLWAAKDSGAILITTAAIYVLVVSWNLL
jgi:hypothetical protein